MRISDWSSDVCSSDLGIGKSGHIAKKIASTFSSIGKPSVFVHAAEASHGDLGLVQANCAVLILSNYGETSELSDLIHYCKVHGISTIDLTAHHNSILRSEERRVGKEGGSRCRSG